MPKYNCVWRILKLFKILFASFLSFFLFVLSSNAACDSGYYLAGTGDCKLCDAGSYCPNGITKYSCERPYRVCASAYRTDYPVKFSVTGGKTAEEACNWEITISENNKLTCEIDPNNHKNYNIVEKNCDMCQNSEERTVTNKDENFEEKLNELFKCDNAIYKITLKASDPDDLTSTNTRELYVKHGKGFATEENPKEWIKDIENIRPTFNDKWWLNDFIKDEYEYKNLLPFKGYFYDNRQIVSEGGTPSPSIIENPINNCNPTEAQAEYDTKVDYSITYLNNMNNAIEVEICYFIRDNTECIAKNYPDIPKPDFGNRVFKSWCIKEGDSCTKEIKVGEEIPRPQKGFNVALAPILEDCPAGYYCTNGNKNACPGGTTSDKGSSSIKDCYLKGGVTQMCGVFNGKTQCATLDSGTDKIYY